MPWQPVAFAGVLMLATIGIYEFTGWDAKIVALAVAAGALSLIALVAGICLLLRPSSERAEFRRIIAGTAREDLSGLRDTLVFRR